MPRPPDTSRVSREIRGSVFSALAHRIAGFDGEVYPFHVGDTWLEPVASARMENLRTAEIDGLHRYADPAGLDALRDLLVERTRERTGVAVERDQVSVVAGATAGLNAVLHALLEPGEEVLIAAPFWPLIDGIVRAAHGTPVAVPILDAADAGAVVDRLAAALGPRTAALYLSSPNNPTGRVLPRPWIEAMVAWATAHGLWVISDEVYEDYVFRGEHTPVLGLAPERTVAAYSFSKAYGMAGNRCGWVVAPVELLAAARKLGTHTFYSTSTAGQHAAIRALRDGDAWLRDARTRYREAGEQAAELLGVAPPEGGTFLFLDVAPQLDDRGLLGFLEACADRGVFLAPGPSFGPYESWVRLCFTAVDPARTERGARALRRLLDARVGTAPGVSRGASR
ncbi:MAG TPA: pyridoxal phosphate-dependent aminotransferase [Thermoanaerobaculia bacterium]|nr:pyridoxal phosphate-dependent aminotransferase [Thermoanaerobaculia bacterium]